MFGAIGSLFLTSLVVSRAERAHWAFQTIARPSLPTPSNGDWARNEIDLFVLSKLESHGLAPSPEASESILRRRLYLDLVGLPPSVDNPLLSTEGDALGYERLVGRLLASPHFGERWALPWLDLARYGDSHGYERDEPRRYAWMWREWLIDAINRDLPYDAFTREQIAGDLLPEARFDQILATGFHRHAPYNTAGGTDREELRVKSIVDRVNTVGTVWLGLSLGCAQCHDHKYDPISQDDYYRFFAFFNDAVDDAGLSFSTTRKETADYERRLAKHQAGLRKLEAQLAAAPENQQREIEVQIKRHNKRQPKPPASSADVLARRLEEPRQSYVMGRGDYRNRKQVVSASLPSFGDEGPGSVSTNRPLDRLDLAGWLTDPSNPLVARVEVDRVWRGLFGEGLVSTPEDFGTRSRAPDYLELLDWLATYFIETGWSRKTLVKLIVDSATYRQTSRLRMDAVAVDSENRLFWRQNRYRLPAELIRDQNLATAGLLRMSSIGGWSFRPALPESMRNLPPNYRWEHDGESEWRRRGVYLWVQRNMIHPDLKIFDRPERVAACPVRDRTNTPLQALKQWNDHDHMELYRAISRELLSVESLKRAERLIRLFQRCLTRRPEDREVEILENQLESFLEEFSASPDDARRLVGDSELSDSATIERASWIALTRVVMNVDEFIVRP